MKIVSFVGVCTLSAALAACGSGGDIKVDARNQSSVDNSVGNDSQNVINEGTGGGNGGANNPCASYTEGTTLRQGSYNAPHCTYGTDFVSISKPYVGEEELVFNDLPNDGAHIFNDSLIVGQNYRDDAGLAEAGLTQGGDGSSIRLNPGVTLAFRSNDDYMVINRGSQIFAEGTQFAPVTVTSTSDAVDGTVGPEDVQQWGGMIINGFGITNKCSYEGTAAAGDLVTSDCHVDAEGKDGAGITQYGGSNNADNSGVLKYFVLKHSGAQVAPGNELNGITFNAVGSGTEVDYLQVYATYDDGIEFFGGAVNVSHFVGMYSRDDTIDIDEAYSGTIEYALVIQNETDGDHCIESDGIGSWDSLDENTIAAFIAQGINSRATIRNLTCIVSPNPASSGTHGTPGNGWRIREAHFPIIENSIVTTAHMASSDDDNYCVRIDSTEGLQAAQDGDLVIAQNVFACNQLTTGAALPDATTQLEFLQANNAVMQTAEAGQNPEADDMDMGLAILDGFYSLPLGDMIVNAMPVSVTPTEGRDFIGGVTRDNDWTVGWTYGLHPENRAMPLWFEAE
ncbi:MAG TPA: serine/threonine protein kinase [Marinagarivorans sp.]